VNVFLRELKALRKSLVIWCIGILAMVAGGMSKYGATESAGQSINELMASMPKALQAIMGTGSLDLTTVSGYYGILFLYLIVMTTIHAVMLGANIVSKEERDKTAEFLLVKPISRKQVIFSKWMASLVAIIVINLVTFLISHIMVNYYNKTDDSYLIDIAELMGGMFILQLLFLCLGTSIAASMKHPKRAASISTAVLLITFFLSMAINLNENLEILSVFTPFKYFEAQDIIGGTGYEALYIMVSIILVVVLTIYTFIAYEKRDLHI
jgi:ABC-2 type transport system permease protein